MQKGEGIMVKVALLILFAMASGFVGGVMYARDVYRPLVDWYCRKTRRDEC